jgi:lipopolysaccharide transport system permease protein
MQTKVGTIDLPVASLGRQRTREYYRDLIWALLVKEFKVRYKSTVLGYAWSVLHPLLFTLVYLFLFKIVLKVQIENYTLFLMAGVFPWQAFQNSVGTGSTVFIDSRQSYQASALSKGIHGAHRRAE